jgi:transposase
MVTKDVSAVLAPAKLRKAYKSVVRLSPSDSAKLVFLVSAMIQLWNRALNEAENWLEQNEGKEKKDRKAITAFTFNYWLTGMRDQSIDMPDVGKISLRDFPIDVEREVLRKLAGSYKSFFELRKRKDNRARKPRPKRDVSLKKPFMFLALSWASAFQVHGNVVEVTGFRKEKIRIPIGEYLEERVRDKEIVHVTISLNDDGQLVLSLVTTAPLPPVYSTPNFFRAIDLGAGDIAVTDSDGTEFLIPARRADKHWGRVVRAIEYRLKNPRRENATVVKKDSRRYRGLMTSRRRVFGIQQDQQISFQRKLAHALVQDKVQCIVLGKARTRLGLAQSSGTNQQHYGVQNTGYMSRLPIFIKEKAAERGVRVIELPDPVREGRIDDPSSKFKATRTLLSQALSTNDLPMPQRFLRKGFAFGGTKGEGRAM